MAETDQNPNAADDCASCPICTMRDAIFATVVKIQPEGDPGIPLDAMVQVMAFLMSAGTPAQQDIIIDNITQRLRECMTFYREHPEACIAAGPTEH